MRFHVITLFPEMVVEACAYGVVGQAVREGKLQLDVVNPRAFTSDVHRSVDDRPFGGGDGMVMLPEPLDTAIEQAKSKSKGEKNLRKLCLSARGRKFDDTLARELAGESEILLVCGRYGGIDQRVIVAHDLEEITVGDYVLSGGELGALIVIDSVGRLLPGVLGNSASPHEESFAKGLLEHPQFTRPRTWKGFEVPEAVLSGNHARIDEWRRAMSVLWTAKMRPDLLSVSGLTAREAQKALSLWDAMSEADRYACGLDGAGDWRARLTALPAEGRA